MGVRETGVEVVSEPQLLPALARMPGHLFWRAAARVDLLLDELRPDGFDVYAFATLLALADAEPRSQQDVARSIGASRTTIARAAAALETAGLVERVRNPEDRRSYALTRTPAGVKAIHTWQPYADRLEPRLTAALSAADVEELRRLLRLAAGPGLSTDTPAGLSGSIGFLVHQIHLRMHPEFAKALRPLGIEPRHFGSLVVLQHLGPAAQQELARAMGVSAASAVALVDELEKAGLVERRRDETDRRAQLLTLRPGATDVVAKARRTANALHRRQLAALEPSEVDRLVVLLAAVVKAK